MAQSQFVVQVINVTQPSFTKTPKGGYNQIEVAYKKDGKVDGKKIVEFVHPEVYEFLRTLKGGEIINVTSEKKEGEKFWNWIAVSPAGSAEASAQNDTAGNKEPQRVPVGQSGDSTGNQTTPSGRGRVTGSNYETPEERALRREADRVRQYYIVRQSSVSAAIELLKAKGDPFDTGNVIEKAREIEAYVFEPVPEAGGEVPSPKDETKKKRGRPAKTDSSPEVETPIPF